MQWLRRRLAVQTAVVFVICSILIFVCNIYFLHLHSRSQKDAVKSSSSEIPEGKIAKPSTVRAYPVPRLPPSIADQIKERWNKVPLSAALEDERDWHVPYQSIAEDGTAVEDLWTLAGSWGSARQVYAKEAEGLRALLRAMATARVVGATVGIGGTQLKATLTLQGGQQVVFKPMRYRRDAVFTDSPYAGADRHNGEIAAFHLSRLLDFRWSPLVAGRRLNLKTEVLPVAEETLKKTFFTEGNDTCFYGVCYYCNRQSPACADGDVMEGAVILWLPKQFKLKMHRHPWRRLYKKGHLAPWEVNDDHCLRVRSHKLYSRGPRLLDLIDVAVFDFLISNADRHLYEVLDGFDNGMVILMDNGKSFGNPSDDEVTILAPLYQCCRIRKGTLEKLEGYPGRSLSHSLLQLTRFDPLHPVLTEEHLLALDRRRLKVLDVVDFCMQRHGQQNVLVED